MEQVDVVTAVGGRVRRALDATRVISPAPRDVWRRALAEDPNAVATQSPEWLDCLCEARGYVDASRLYELEDGRAIVLPLVGKVVAGVRVGEASWPYGWGYGGAVVTGGQLTVADARLVLADLARRPVVRAAVVPMPLTAAVWQQAAPRRAQRVPYQAQVIDLDGGFDTVWSKRYRSQVRTAIRKAERSNLEIREERGTSTISAFAELYQQSLDRWARQCGQPLQAARLLARSARLRDRVGQVAAASAGMGDLLMIRSAYRAGEPVGVNVEFRLGQHVVWWLGAMNKQLANETRATYLLHSRAIEDACHLGARYFHMGESDAGSEVAHYKSKFGATPVEYETLRFERLPLTPAERWVRAVVERASDHRGSWLLRRARSS